MKGTKAVAILCCMILLTSLLAGCGEREAKVVIGGNGYDLPVMTNEELEKEAEQIEEQGLYIYVSANESAQSMSFVKLAESKRGAEFDYYGGTTIMNRFGESITMDKLKPGTIFTLELDDAGTLIKSMKESDKVWTFENIENYQLDFNQDMMIIGGENYYLEELIPVFDGHDMLSRNQIAQSDILTLVGYGRTLLSVQISTAHGELAFKNTKDIENGYFVLGNVAAAPIKKGACLSVRAGSFLLSVAATGRFGSTDVTIDPGKKTTVDLSKFVTKETRTSQITFVVEQPGTKVYLNGEEVDVSKTQKLTYGAYRIVAKLDGYDTWVRTLFVNSSRATVRISLSKNGTTPNTNQTTQNNNAGDLAGSLAGSLAGDQDGGGNQSNTNENNNNQTGENTLRESLINDVMNLITGN